MMPRKLVRHIPAVLPLALSLVSPALTAEQAPQQTAAPNFLAEWGYILRGALFIFASAMAMVWIGRKLSKRQK